jgi:hypothetical protein
MDRALIYSQMVMYILENIKMGNLMERDSILGGMGLFMLENLRMD